MTPSPRRPLPSRRPALSTTLQIAGWPAVTATIGFDDDEQVRELFLRALKPDSDLDRLLDDAAVVASLALQFGATAGELAYSVARREGVATTPIGAALDFARAEENRLIIARF